MQFFFEKKEQLETKTILCNVLLSFKDKNNERYTFSAQNGILHKTSLTLQKGSSRYTNKRSEEFYAVFESTTINLASLLHETTPSVSKQHKQTKFLSWQYLLKSTKKKVLIEKHKRIVQTIWQALFPFLAFLGIFILASLECATFINSIILSGLLFLIMYTSLALGQASYDSVTTNVFTLYASVVITVMLLVLLYKKKAIL